MNNGDPHLSPNVLFVLKLQTKALKRRPGVASIPSIYHILEAFFSPLYLIFNFFFLKIVSCQIFPKIGMGSQILNSRLGFYVIWSCIDSNGESRKFWRVWL